MDRKPAGGGGGRRDALAAGAPLLDDMSCPPMQMRSDWVISKTGIRQLRGDDTSTSPSRRWPPSRPDAEGRG
ncbi:MAG: hypothetical protein R3F43_06565 [bacterium]